MVDFGDSFAQIKKKTVRGLLKKRAKKYDSDSDQESKPKEHDESIVDKVVDKKDKSKKIVKEKKKKTV